MKKLTRRTIQLVTHNGVPSYRTFASEEGHYVASYEVAELERARVEGSLAGDHPQQGGLAGPVDPDDADLVAPHDP